MTGNSRLRAAFALVAALVIALGIAACGGGDDNNDTGTSGGNSANLIKSNPANNGIQLTVGSKNFTEEFILGNIYAQALQAAGLRREDQPQPRFRGDRLQGAPGRGDQRLPGVHLDAPHIRSSARRRTRSRPMPRPPISRRSRSSSRRARRPSPPTPFADANALGMLKTQGRRARGHQDLRPPGQVPGPDPLRLAGVPPAGRLPGRAAGRLRPAVQVVQPGRHRAPLHGARQGPGGRVDPVHLGRPARRRTRTSTSCSRTTRGSSRPGTPSGSPTSRLSRRPGPTTRRRS